MQVQAQRAQGIQYFPNFSRGLAVFKVREKTDADIGQTCQSILRQASCFSMVAHGFSKNIWSQHLSKLSRIFFHITPKKYTFV